MKKGRLEAFSDGVIAILITIMVLELKTPRDASWTALRQSAPVLAPYVLSFVFLAIYWNNHHHMMHLVDRVNGAILWANMHLLFWLSLVPFVTSWMGQYFHPAPAAAYGVVLLMASIAYYILARVIIASQGPGSRLAAAVGGDRKGLVSTGLYAAAIPLAFWQPWLAAGIYILVALIWLVPDRRIEARFSED
jgi:uncharacterized membrane protein